MAIQNRRGNFVDFDPYKMLAGEFAYALDTEELYYCVSPGNVKRCATNEDIIEVLETNQQAYDGLQQLLTELEGETVTNAQDIINLDTKIVSCLEDYANYQSSNNLKIATVEKELNDYKSTMANVNVNQEAKQTASGYGIVSLPKNSANGQVSVNLKGETRTNLLTENQSNIEIDTSGFALQFKPTITRDTTEKFFGKASLKVVTLGEAPNEGVYTINAKGIANKKYYGSVYVKAPNGADMQLLIRRESTSNITIKYFTGTGSWQRVDASILLDYDTNDLRIYVRTNTAQAITFYIDGLMIEEGERLNNFITGTKSTVSASRLKSVGKNLLDKNKAVAGRIYSEEFLSDGVTVSTETNGDIKIHSTVSFRGFVSEYIKIEPNTAYTAQMQIVSSVDAHNPFWVNGIRWYDKTHTIISSTGDTTGNRATGVSPVNAKYAVIQIVNASPNTTTVRDIQFGEGDQVTPYEPYTESNMYIPNVGELRSLPNGIKDEIRVVNGRAEYIKRVSDEVVFDGSEDEVIGRYSTDNVPEKGYRYKIGELLNVKNIINADEMSSLYSPQIPTLTPLDTYSGKRGMCLDSSSNVLVYNQGEGTIEEFRQWLQENPITLTYQLAEPMITPIEVSGTLLSNPSGTVYVENAVADAGLYTDKLNVLDSELPIAYIEKLSKVDFNTGVETELDSSKCVVAEDKLSFTHPDLTANDIVFFTYYHNLKGTQGETTIKYYDSRHTLKDSVTGKFYKVVPTVSDGVLTNQLVEV